jgi:type II secretory pathway component PulF
MYQDEWFSKLLRTIPAVVDDFIVQYIQLADASGDLG